MSLSSLYGIRPQPASDLAVSRYARPKDPPKAAPAAARSTAPAEHADQLAAVIAAAMTQLGLTAAPGQAAAATAVRAAAGKTAPAIPAGARQVQQYQNIAATFSSLARALDSGAGGLSSASGQASDLTTVFHGLWASLGAAAEAPTTLSGPAAVPNLRTFVQSLASHFGESGIPNLRGVFVDTQA